MYLSDTDTNTAYSAYLQPAYFHFACSLQQRISVCCRFPTLALRTCGNGWALAATFKAATGLSATAAKRIRQIQAINVHTRCIFVWQIVCALSRLTGTRSGLSQKYARLLAAWNWIVWHYNLMKLRISWDCIICQLKQFHLVYSLFDVILWPHTFELSKNWTRPTASNGILSICNQSCFWPNANTARIQITQSRPGKNNGEKKKDNQCLMGLGCRPNW